MLVSMPSEHVLAAQSGEYATANDPDLFIFYARVDWLAPYPRWKFLPAVPEGNWTAEHREDMTWLWQVEHPVRLACGQVASALRIPGIFSRGGFGGGLPRCKGCCRALGGPEGNGSPKNDDRWRKILGLDQ